MSHSTHDETNEIAILRALIALGPTCTSRDVERIARQHSGPDAPTPTKQRLLEVARREFGSSREHHWLRRVLKVKPVRSLSGITPVTVLTKPFPCPGKCIFCPVDVRMPKSYIATEPGALRAGRLGFDPYDQVASRIQSYQEIGHPISKIELIVLGGTWSAYPVDYQRWFITRMFQAMNEFDARDLEGTHAYDVDWEARISPETTYDAHINASHFVNTQFDEAATIEELLAAQQANVDAAVRCVGLSLETRPDLVTNDECVHLRLLGATKIQIGLQSLNDAVLKANKRGHSVKQSENALSLLRQYGFKIHAHWMPNLYGSTPDQDIHDYNRLFENPAIRPDELKVYPCSLIQDTELEQFAEQGKWVPYSDTELREILTHVLTSTPEYCRLTRVIRDIPSEEILAGNKQLNLRQLVEQSIESSQKHDIRAREIRNVAIDQLQFVLEDLTYETAVSTEHFLQYVRPSDRKLSGFLRLSLPTMPVPLDEIRHAAIIREVHVYGQSLDIGASDTAAQHQGLGTQLINEALTRAKCAGFQRIAVISAIGTRTYYERFGFVQGTLYQTLDL